MRLRDHVKVVAVDAETAKGFDPVSLNCLPLPVTHARSKKSLTAFPRPDLGRHHSCTNTTSGDAPTLSMSGKLRTVPQTSSSSSTMALPTLMARSTSGTP